MSIENKGAPLIRIEDVSIAFHGKKALNGLTCEVLTGEIFGFLGPSGAGKTTTIKLLTRQLQADSGRIELFGKPIKDLPQTAFDTVGVLSDNSGLYERLSVRENLVLFAELYGLPAGTADEVLAAVGLSDDSKKTAKVLSRGMKQRLMLARATLHKPRLLFLDEPTAALDPGTAQQIHKLLRSLNEGGTTIFLTTHNMEEADKLCDRVAILDHGAIVAQGAPAALKLTHAKNEMAALTGKGERLTLPKTADGLRQLADRLNGDTLLTLHSQEPNLEEIFLLLTGRDFT